MGLFNLSRVRSALFPAAALISVSFLSAPAVYAGGPVSVDVAAGTTTYSVTNRTINHPLNTTVSAARDITPYVSKVPNGLAQSAAGDLIVATKQGDLNARFTGKFLVQTPVLKEAAKTLLRGAGYAGTAMMAYDGLQAILFANGWHINWSTDQVMQFTPVESWHPGLVQHTDLYPPNVNFDFPFQLQFTTENSIPLDFSHILSSVNCVDAPSGYFGCVIYTGVNDSDQAINIASAMVLPILGPLLQDQVTSCSVFTPNPAYLSCYFPASTADIHLRSLLGDDSAVVVSLTTQVAYYSHVPMQNWETGQVVDHSPYAVGRNNYTAGYAPSDAGGELPVTPNQIENAIDSQYEPSPRDWDAFFNEPDFAPDSFVLDPIPSVTVDTDTSTSVDAVTGNTTVTSTQTGLSFTVTNPPSGIPEVVVTETVSDKQYSNGLLVSDNVTETVRPPISGTNQPPSAGGSTGSGSGSGSGIELPSFCTWASTVCGFINWFKDGDVGADPDLNSIMKDGEDFAKTKVINFGSDVCPAPHTIYISSLSMSVDLSFDFFCQFAQYAKALVLAAAYIFAAYISLGVARG